MEKISERHVRKHLLDKVDELRGKNKGVIDKKAAVSTARDLLVVEELQNALGKVFHKGWVTPPKYTQKRLHRPHRRIVNVLLSDLHFGSHLLTETCPLEYNTAQESRRLGRVVEQVAEYKKQYRQDSKLIVHLLGDIIQGQLHDQRDGDPLAIQFATAVHYLTQAVMFLSSQFPSVDVYCQTGNHGRNMARHHDRAVNEKFDSIETMVYVAVKAAVVNSGITNCKIYIPKTPYYTCMLFDSKMFATHGDGVLKPGYPGRSINIAGLAQQVSKWNTARNIGGPFSVFAVGHVHTGSITMLPGNVAMITNGCLVPPDQFSLTIGNPDNTCGQWIWEAVPGHAIGDQRYVVVDNAEDNPRYNDIIKPFEGL